jgi:hypothetical protein
MLRDRLELLQAFLHDSDRKLKTGTNTGGLSCSYVARLSCTYLYCSPAFFTLLAHHESWPDLMVHRLHLPPARPPRGSSTQGAVGLPAILEHDMHPLVANLEHAAAACTPGLSQARVARYHVLRRHDLRGVASHAWCSAKHGFG